MLSKTRVFYLNCNQSIDDYINCMCRMAKFGTEKKKCLRQISLIQRAKWVQRISSIWSTLAIITLFYRSLFYRHENSLTSSEIQNNTTRLVFNQKQKIKERSDHSCAIWTSLSVALKSLFHCAFHLLSRAMSWNHHLILLVSTSRYFSLNQKLNYKSFFFFFSRGCLSSIGGKIIVHTAFFPSACFHHT